MSMKLFMFSYNRYRKYDSLLVEKFGEVSGRRRAYYALMGGIARAGVYLFS